MKNKYKTEEKKNPKLVNMILAVHLKEHVRVPEVERQTVPSPPSLVETQSERTEVPQKVARTEGKEDSREEEKEDEDGEIEGALSESSDEDDSDDDLRIRDIL